VESKAARLPRSSEKPLRINHDEMFEWVSGSFDTVVGAICDRASLLQETTRGRRPRLQSQYAFRSGSVVL